MTYSATKLRQNLYQVLDQVLDSGIPVEIERRGKILRLVPKGPIDPLERLERRTIVVGDSEELVHMDWSGDWKPSRGIR